MLHPGLLLQPQFDEVLLFHLPTQIGEHYNPYEGKALPSEHFVNRPIYSPINRKLQQDITNVLDDEPSSLHCHAGNWINKHPDDIPNLELEPIGYSRRWLGEERMGGGWSSDMCPLSGDRHALCDKLNKLSLQEPSEADEDEDMVVRRDAEGNVHLMPRKK
ncbi:hypothetical protein GUITHDRAFT_104853 [Guillardia theta CCMP2712]|uniref:Uncharacterized protein n=1 Tax=Guillardia theta (strain CCMP2712) TaxID=905079 RepID=L1JMC9_GUITC|nr:hypothetical protein GUITHDRAFT_104853 [Guillardia theta CCMP2712]EKX49325.1 hypothetical protein GUITHDRAFT_104853 [Guillardia theta CCMP2712]|eukprot:XP_005836305.1 hypothetical protein GUITHDRAFT_104853 [Guillardia theta CCMP2712]